MEVWIKIDRIDRDDAFTVEGRVVDDQKVCSFLCSTLSLFTRMMTMTTGEMKG
jgi:hypothetical protein